MPALPLGTVACMQARAGWVASRLNLAKEQLELSDARHARVVLRAGTDATFEVAREQGERLVRATASVDGRGVRGELLPLPDDSLVWSPRAGPPGCASDGRHHQDFDDVDPATLESVAFILKNGYATSP